MKAVDLPKGPGREGALRAVSSRWAQNSPADAFAWANTIAEKGSRTGALQSVLTMWASQDPAGAKVGSENLLEIDFADGQPIR